MHCEKLEDAMEALGLALSPRVMTFESESGVVEFRVPWCAGGGTCRKMSVPFSMSTMASVPCTISRHPGGGRWQAEARGRWGEQRGHWADRCGTRPPLLVLGLNGSELSYDSVLSQT